MKRRAKTPLDRAVYTLQTGNIHYRLEEDAPNGLFRLFIGGVSIPQVYDRDGKPVDRQPGKAK